jgi:G:T-mismatch repair DNA endonuclease (very short patch repair protein)
MLNKRQFYVNKIGRTLKEAKKEGVQIDEAKFIAVITQEAEVSNRIAKEYLSTARQLMDIKEGSLDNEHQNTL